jgi:isoleucyl-tRNA synthetase
VRGEDKVWLLVWTTTPWTLPSNVAVAVGPDIEYVRVRDGEDTYILAKTRIETVFPKIPDPQKITGPVSGRELAGLRYEPLFPYFVQQYPDIHRVILGDFVSTEEGTGLVHMAPAFGEDDFNVAEKNGLPIINPVDAQGCFTAQVPDYAGQEVKAADKKIIADLKARGLVFDHRTFQHSYPFCYRCDSPLIYMALSTWFCRIEPLKEDMLRNNQQIHWVPAHIRDGRFGKWLANARDWNLARNRYWGTPIPVWICAKGHTRCVGDRAELETLGKRSVSDLHKHFVDEITFPCPECGESMRRTTEVLDCWFESGSMPYAQNHYPFENKQLVEDHLPADFIAEGLDQTRGWFYTLTVLATAQFNRPAFKNVIVNGMILAADGKKMSKRLKNYPDPDMVMDSLGADALRLYLINSPAVQGDDLRFSEDGVREILRTVIIPFWNAYNFFVEYATTDGWGPKQALVRSTHELDRWILSRLQTLISRVNQEMEEYRLYAVVPALVAYIDELTNWYIRRSRERFWSNAAEHPQEKKEAYSTLYTVLSRFIRTLAPFLPFVTESIYQNLKVTGDPASVHLCDFPQPDPAAIDEALETRMALVRDVVHLASSLRQKHELKVRQPLRQLTVVIADNKKREIIKNFSWLIKEEINVKNVEIRENEEDFVILKAKANFKVLGKELGPKMKDAAAEIMNIPPAGVAALFKTQSYTIPSSGNVYRLDQVLIERVPQSNFYILASGEVTVAIDGFIDKELILEGHSIELKSQINRMRKESGLDKEDRINLFIQTNDPEIIEAIEKHKNFIMQETLSISLKKGFVENALEINVNDKPVSIGMQKAGLF